MRRSIHLLALILSLTVFKTIFSQDIEKKIKEKEQAINTYIEQELVARKIPGLVYGVFGKDSLLSIHAFGFADIQNQAPSRNETVFALASITKQFTAAAILILHQDGKLQITDKISKYFPECPRKWKNITIQHLLTHTSGLPGLYGEGGFNNRAFSGIGKMTLVRALNESWTWPKDFMIDAIKTDRLSNLPGENFNYSDVGYALLGIIIDNISGSYRNFLEERIFKPANMTYTYIIDQKAIHPLEARGYSLMNGELINILRFGDCEIPSHFGVFSNVIDMQKWDAMLNTNTVLSNESKKILWTNNRTNNGKLTGYGFGWFISNFGEKLIVNHSGVTGTEILKLVNNQVSICVLTNLGYNGYDTPNSWGLANDIAKILDLKSYVHESFITEEGHKIVPLDLNQIQKFLGSFLYNGDPVKIYLDGGKLLWKQLDKVYELALLDDGSLIFLWQQTVYLVAAQENNYEKLKLNNIDLIRLKEE